MGLVYHPTQLHFSSHHLDSLSSYYPIVLSFVLFLYIGSIEPYFVHVWQPQNVHV